MEKIIKLNGRIDSNNVLELENNILNEINNYDGEIILDAEGLEYIASAGLRMILKIKKKNDKTKVINCNTDIYEIFEMTGFSQMMDISKKIRTISIDGCEVLGEGFYGTVYRINPETIVKVYKRLDSPDMVMREKELSKKAFILGIPTAIPYDIVKVGNLYGSVFEFLNCKTLNQLINEGEDIEELGKECAIILKKMHETVVDTDDLKNRKEKILENANACRELLGTDTYNNLITFIESIKDQNTMIHGDFQIKNLMKQDGEILIIDMATLSYGNPIFELSAMYSSYVAFACVNKNNCQEFLGVPYEKTILLWNSIFNNYYDNITEEEKEKIMDEIKILSYLQVLNIRSRFNDETNKYQNEEIEFAKKYIQDNIEKVISIDII